ncbi:MAG: hypothetical protein KatS3mg082_3216 [Nitrospiraceae bacterium]|nr:MAG: hypothetical protein KatS3mg082_3216 [Nitrospiraceae bacterium]
MDVFSSIPGGRASRALLAAKTRAAAVVFAANFKCMAELRGLGAGRAGGPPLVLKRNGVLGIPPRVVRRAEPPRILGLGALVPKKGFDTLVRACALVIRERPDIVLEIHGEGPERPHLERLARELRLPVRLPGSYRHGDLAEILQGAAVVALLSRRLPTGDSDGVPTVLIEALAHGCPVVATPVGSISDLVVNGETGWVVPPDDPDSAARAILQILENRHEAERRALNGRRRVEEEFLATRAARAMVAAIVDVHARLAGGSGVNVA